MKIKLRTSQDIHSRDVKRLSDTLNVDPSSYELFQFSLAHPNNCVVYKMSPYLTDVELVVQHVLTAATVDLYALSVAEDHRGWMFMLPSQGNILTTGSGLIFTKPDLTKMKTSLQRQIKTIENEVKSLTPEVYLPHSDFNILGLNQGDIIFVARNHTSVVTQ